eukprot:120776-Prymnesium_polylepis.1
MDSRPRDSQVRRDMPSQTRRIARIRFVTSPVADHKILVGVRVLQHCGHRNLHLNQHVAIDPLEVDMCEGHFPVQVVGHSQQVKLADLVPVPIRAFIDAFENGILEHLGT